MEIPAWVFLSFWAIASTTFLHLGFHALDKTEVSPLVLLLLKHSLAISSCSSSSYALKYRAHPRHQSPYLLIMPYATLSALLATTTDGILLRAILTSSYAKLLLMLKSLPVPNDSWKTMSRILLGLKTFYPPPIRLSK